MPTSTARCPTLSSTDHRGYLQNGFLVVKQVFALDEIRDLQAECDRLLTERSDLINPSNLRCRYMPHYQTGEPLFELFDPVSDISPLCEQFAADPRIVGLVESIYGEACCLFKEKLIFKPPGALGYNLHQDIPYGWRGFPASFLTVMIPIDPSTEENGCTEVFAGYHQDFLSKDASVYMLPEDCVDIKRRHFLSLEPGDIALFHGLTPHRSAPNRSDQMRRVLFTSYNTLADGGNQRAAHYAEFHERLRLRPRPGQTDALYFR